MKTTEPGSHTGIAKYFGLLFLFQALVALCAALTEQLYDSAFSLYFAVLSVVAMFLAVGVSIPASVAVAVPELDKKILQAVVFCFSLAGIICSTFLIGPSQKAVLELPFVPRSVKSNALGAMGGAFVMVSVAAATRSLRKTKGRSGAVFLGAGMTLASLSGMFWVWVEPMCRRVNPGNAWPESCPLPVGFNHNSLMTLFLIVANIYVAEGAIRLMTVESGPDIYRDIPDYLNFVDPMYSPVEHTYRTFSVRCGGDDPYCPPPCSPCTIICVDDGLDRQ